MPANWHFPGDTDRYQKTLALMKKCLPLLEQCKQQSQLSLATVFDRLLYAQQQRQTPAYCKKGAIRRSLIVDNKEFYILLKSKGAMVKKV